MNTAIGLLNRILDSSDPQDIIHLPLQQARLIASLSARELGTLHYSIAKTGLVEAMEHHGLFSRSIVVDHDGLQGFIVERFADRENAAIAGQPCWNECAILHDIGLTRPAPCLSPDLKGA